MHGRAGYRGEEPEKHEEGDLLRGYVYDVIGSEVVENAADMMQEELKAEAAAHGKKITNRFSPGYCGWDVAEQHKLFSFFQGQFLRNHPHRISPDESHQVCQRSHRHREGC